MSNVSKHIRRKRRGAKKLDMTKLKKVLQDNSVWCAVGIVQDSDGSGSHFELDGEDLTVEVQLQPSQEEITARVGTVAGTFGAGIWSVPPVGAEVLVAFPNGDLALQPTIVCLYSSGSMPTNVSETTIVIAAPSGGKVLIHDGSGGAEPLITKSQFDAHKHPSGTGPTGVPDNIATSGTVVLEAK